LGDISKNNVGDIFRLPKFHFLTGQDNSNRISAKKLLPKISVLSMRVKLQFVHL
jgi:hypothetical protein